MPKRPIQHRPAWYNPDKPRHRDIDHDKHRGNANERGYNHRWQKARKTYLRQNPLCVHCESMEPSIVTPATEVDHIIPHRGDTKLFWDKSNWQALCKPCHSHKTNTEDRVR